MSLFVAAKLQIPLGPPRQIEVDLRLDAGEVLHLRGRSGSGKTTLLRALARLHGAKAGELALAGAPQREIAPPRWRQQVAYLPQRPVMLPGSVRQNLEAPFCARRATRAFDHDAAAALLQRVGLATELMTRDAALLSGGEAARVALCRALLLEPRVLLCDELTAGLDDESARRTVALVAKEMADGVTIIVAHDLTPWRVNQQIAARLRSYSIEGAT